MTDVLAPVAKKLHFLDEVGMHLGLTRLYGRAAPGQRVVEATPGYSGPHYTGVAALTLRGVQAPSLRRGDIVVLDNLSPHKQAMIRALIEARGAMVEFLPPYSPDFHPIEQCWAKVRAGLRQAKARTFAALLEALTNALRAVSPQDAAA